MNDNDEIKIFKPFGPPIGKFEIEQDLVNRINKYIDKLVQDKEKSSKLDAGKSLAGQVNQEIKFEKEFCEEFIIPTLINKIRTYIFASTNKKISKHNFESIWTVRQFENEYNPTHYHSGHISGAGFLKLPKTFGKHVQEKNIDYKGGNLQLIHGNRLFLCPSLLDIKPKVGDFYFFPHYLMHTVFPFRGSEEERRSISFNATIDEEIFNVYGK